jgi:hypothetical protein
MAQFHRAREILGIIGLAGGIYDHNITIDQAEIHLLKSEYAQARSIHSHIAEITSPNENAAAYAYTLLNIAEIDVRIGVAEQDVHRNLDSARAAFHNLKYQREIIFCDMTLADLELRERKFSLARTLFHRSLNLSLGMDSQITSYHLERLADISQWNPAGVEGELSWPVVYLGYSHKSKQKLALHKALLFLGDVFISKNNDDTAHNLYTVALEGFTYMDVHSSRAQCMLRLGDLANKRGIISKATELWKAARPLFEQSLQAKDVAQIDARLTAAAQAHQKALEYLIALHAPVQLLQDRSITDQTSNIEEREDGVNEDGLVRVSV